MISVLATTLILFGHWAADFVWQPHWMGMRKSKEWWVLIQHGARITAGGLLTAAVIVALLGGSWLGVLWWALINGVAHIGIDAVTSRMTGRLYAKGDMHNFFVVIGFDQFLHVSLAVATFVWLIV